MELSSIANAAMMKTVTPDLSNVSLTPRQREILERVAARLSLKQIAGELGCSESAVNQRIKSLKHRFGVNSLSELSDCFHRLAAFENAQNNVVSTCSESACSFSQLPDSVPLRQPGFRNDPAVPLVFQDAQTFMHVAPWERLEPTSVAPGVLNGPSAGLYRTGFIIVLAFLMFATLILAVAAGEALSGIGRG
jgi:DNA-binding CsgD family transcriptional regulator